jgi:hypothetical protein
MIMHNGVWLWCLELISSFLEHILMREVVGGCLQDIVIDCYDADDGDNE